MDTLSNKILSLLALSPKTKTEYPLITQTANPLSILQIADAHRERVDIFPKQRTQNAGSPVLSGHFVSCEGDGLLLEFPCSAETLNWKYQDVDVYFKVHNRADNTVNFYTFSSEIKSTWDKEGQLYVAMLLPGFLHKDQKRAFFRLDSASSLFSTLMLWVLEEERETTNISCQEHLGEPLFCLQAGKDNDIVIHDLSAGGIRLCLKNVDSKYLACALDWKHLILSAVFIHQTIKAELNQFFFKCLCRHINIEEGKADILLGIQFQEWCSTETLKKPIALKPVEADGGIPFLCGLLSKEQLARKKIRLA